jgi:uncharacterized protein (TIGR02246 family)
VRLHPTAPLRPLRLALLAAALLSGGCFLFRAASPPADPVAELISLERELANAVQAKDGATLTKLLVPEFQLLSPREKPAGREAFIQIVLGMPGKLELQFDRIEARVVGEVGVINGVQRARLVATDGRSIDDLQAFTEIAVLRNGRWRLAISHSAPIAK